MFLEIIIFLFSAYAECELKIAQQAFDYFTQLVEVFRVPCSLSSQTTFSASPRYWVLGKIALCFLLSAPGW